MSNDPSARPSARPRTDSSEAWKVQNLEKETMSSFSFQKPPGKGPPASSSSSSLPAPSSSRPPPPSSSLGQPNVSPYFSSQSKFGASSASSVSRPSQQQQKQPSSSSSANSSRSHPSQTPSAFSSSTPSDPTPSRPSASDPSQPLRHIESSRSTNASGTTHSGEPSSTQRQPPSPPRVTSSSSRSHQQQSQQFRSSNPEHQPRAGEAAISTSTSSKRTDAERRRDQDQLEDDIPISSSTASKGKARATEGAGEKEQFASSQRGFSAFAASKASLDARPLAPAATPSIRGAKDPFASTPAPVSDPAATDSPPQPRALFPLHKDSATLAPRKPTSKAPPITKVPNQRRSSSLRPDEVPRQQPNSRAVSPSRARPSGFQPSKPKPIARAGSGSSLGEPRPVAGAPVRKRALPEAVGLSGSGAKKQPSAASGPSRDGGASRKRPRDDDELAEGDKENGRRKASKIYQDIGEMAEQVERRGEEIKRLNIELWKHEQTQKTLEGQVETAKSLAVEMRRKFAAVEDTVTDIVKSKKVLDKSRAEMAREVDGYQAFISSMREWEADKDEVFRTGDSWHDRQRRALADTIHPLEAALKETKERAEKAEGSLEVLRKNLLNTASDLAEKSNRVASLEEKDGKKDETISKLSDDLMKSVKEGKREVEDLREELGKEILTLKELLTKSEGHAGDFEGAVAESERELEDVKKQLAAKGPELGDLRQKIADLETSLKEKEALLAKHHRDLGEQAKALDAARNSSEALKADLANARARHKELEAHLAQIVEDLKTTRAEAKAAIQEKEKKIKSLSEALDNSKNQHHETSKKLAVSTTKLDEKDKLVRTFEERVAELTNDKKGLEKSNEELHNRIQAVITPEPASKPTSAHSRSEVDTLSRKLKAAEAATADSSAQLKKAASQVADLQKKLESASAESQQDAIEQAKAEWLAEQEKMKTELESQSNALADKTKALDSLQTQASKDKEAAERRVSELEKTVQDLVEKRKTLADRFKSRTGTLDTDEGKIVDAIASAIELSFEKRNADHSNAIKKTENKIKALEREKKDLEAKLAKANVGKSRNLIEPDRYAQSSSPAEQEQDESSSGGSQKKKLDSPMSPSPQNALAALNKPQQPALKSALKSSSKMLPPPVPTRPRLNANDSSPLTAEEDAGETQVVAVSPPRKGPGGVNVPRGTATAGGGGGGEASGSRKRGAGLEDLAGGAFEGEETQGKKKARSNSTGSTSAGAGGGAVGGSGSVHKFKTAHKRRGK